MTTEDDFQAALDADPGNGLLRLLLADWLDENAREVECPRCDGSGWRRNHTHVTGRGHECPVCSGTGTVSDGRRERACGYRALAELGRVPIQMGRDGWAWYMASHCEGEENHTESNLCDGWFLTLAAGVRYPSAARYWVVFYPTRREAEHDAALVFGRLPADVQARILAGVTA